MKFAIQVFFYLTIILFSSSAIAYRLPNYTPSQTQIATPSENVLSKLEYRLNVIALKTPIEKIKEHEKNYKVRLTSTDVKNLHAYKKLKIELNFWNYVVKLKHDILSLHEVKPSKDILNEADFLSKRIITVIYRLSNEYKIHVSALFQNFLVRIGAAKSGHCYQYVADLLYDLSRYKWRYFDLQWGVSNEGHFDENNALIITAKGMPIKSGLAVDAWRAASKPFWIRTNRDHYKWKKCTWDRNALMQLRTHN